MKLLLNILSQLHPEVDFMTENRLVDRGILDSFDLISIVAEVDEVFGVAIPAGKLLPENFNSAVAMYGMIRSLVEAK